MYVIKTPTEKTEVNNKILGKKSRRENRRNRPQLKKGEFKPDLFFKILIGFFENPLITFVVCSIIGITWGFIEGAKTFQEFAIFIAVTIFGGIVYISEVKIENPRLRSIIRVVFGFQIGYLIGLILDKSGQSLAIFGIIGALVGYFSRILFNIIARVEKIC